ncbi:MAG: HDIG domain-containing protein, partial [Sphaerochaetaceae bacterium]|nr:HDIG domain-containing protein [Sphaerochaetaceae bacterium]
SALLPLLEDLFNIPTQFKLRELANARSPILQRLSQEAPGTYSHSMAVADIAETAARAVGANAALVRVGAMYHDIGKIDHAEYFTENISLLGNSPAAQSHENINRNLSVAIIKSHVKLGVEKGKQIGLPQEVLDIIGNHHGNDVVVYFYNEAMKLHEENPEQYNEPKIEEYAYLGQPPQTPEQAIVMLADCSEAACRSIAKPTPNKIEKMITMILIKKIVNKQLSSCGMSITDLNDVVKSLSESLTGRYHSRISYPEEEEKK